MKVNKKKEEEEGGKSLAIENILTDKKRDSVLFLFHFFFRDNTLSQEKSLNF